MIICELFTLDEWFSIGGNTFQRGKFGKPIFVSGDIWFFSFNVGGQIGSFFFGAKWRGIFLVIKSA